jgi:RNA polymerase sigma factor (sigma-70 family)
MYRQFLASMNASIKQIKSGKPIAQEEQFNILFRAEDEFKKILTADKKGTEIYEEFIHFVDTDIDKRQVKVFFRERQDQYAKGIFKAMKKGNIPALQKYRINYIFMKWVMDRYTGKNKLKLKTIMTKTEQIREHICKENMPLALHRARLYSSKIENNSHLAHMDLVQYCAEGLIQAIDKFVPPFKLTWLSTAIGRMTDNMSTGNQAGTVKLPSNARRILYRVNLAMKREGFTDEKEILKYVKDSFPKTTMADIKDLLETQVSVVQLDVTSADKTNIEEKEEKNQLTQLLRVNMDNLSVIEKKVIIMRFGV